MLKPTFIKHKTPMPLNLSLHSSLCFFDLWSEVYLGGSIRIIVSFFRIIQLMVQNMKIMQPYTCIFNIYAAYPVIKKPIWKYCWIIVFVENFKMSSRRHAVSENVGPIIIWLRPGSSNIPMFHTLEPPYSLMRRKYCIPSRYTILATSFMAFTKVPPLTITGLKRIFLGASKSLIFAIRLAVFQ